MNSGLSIVLEFIPKLGRVSKLCPLALESQTRCWEGSCWFSSAHSWGHRCDWRELGSLLCLGTVLELEEPHDGKRSGACGGC